MKHLITAITIALGLACVGGVSAAQDVTQPSELRTVTVNKAPVQYETYVADLPAGFTLQVFVGHAHSQYVQAQRAADELEAQRMQGMASQPLVSVAIDNSTGPGVARRIQLSNSAQETIAVVDVYCKRAVPSGGAHCQLAPLPMRTHPRLASLQAGNLQLAEVDMHD